MLNIPKNPNESGNRIPESPVFPKKKHNQQILKSHNYSIWQLVQISERPFLQCEYII